MSAPEEALTLSKNQRRLRQKHSMAQRIYHRAKACLRCHGNLVERAEAKENPCKFQYVFPCGHILCQRCFDAAAPYDEASECDRCGSCIWRRSTWAPSSLTECAHCVPFASVPAGTKPPLEPGMLKLGWEKIGRACGRCVAERLLRRLTEEARATGVPGAEVAVACLGTGMDALHGWVAPEMTIEEMGAGGEPMALPELAALASGKMEEMAAALEGLRAERGWKPSLLLQGVVFREPYKGAEPDFDYEKWLDFGDDMEEMMNFDPTTLEGEAAEPIDFNFD
ncbi:hypothetical protein PLICBS_009790 [Purpureocillium lilacinum]|uniref:uncharacterized protein n=1 Tax=Purpureocillium lilacinum TaxID=33203 RepID=UPI00208033C5|nr:hypothetical protein PLICBS_009790 [Purpureocillium lilacinum]